MWGRAARALLFREVTLLTIPRSVLKRFRTLCRRGGLHKTRTSGGPIVTCLGTPEGLRMQCSSPDVAIEYYEPGPCDIETIRLPLTALETCEGRNDAPVTLEALTDQRALLSWVDHGVPRQHEVDQPKPSTQSFPTQPTKYETNAAAVWADLREAVATTDPQSSRYALGCLHLRGRSGRIEATDGRQVLVGSGVRFGFEDEVLVPGSKLLGCSELDFAKPFGIGRAGEWIGLSIDNWTILLRIQKEGRFPKIDDVIPPPRTNQARLDLSVGDAKILCNVLPRLPSDHPIFSPLTLDLNGQVLLRVREAESSRPTQLELHDSRTEGRPLVLNMNRGYLARALRLGFRTLYCFGTEAPILCDDGRRRYLWAVLDSKSAIPRHDHPVQVIPPAPARRPAKRARSLAA